jgi:serine/threonine protein kinase
MNPERWQQVKEIFQAALDLPLPDRTAYARHASDGDEELFEDVVSLLASEENSGQFLGQAAAEYAPGAFSDTSFPDANAGRRIGPYHIVRRIGAGGMGAVYLAERVDEFRQKVALKLMHRDVASPAVISQFRRE